MMRLKPTSTIGTHSRPPTLKLLLECISSGSRNAAEELLMEGVYQNSGEDVFISPLSNLRVIPEALDELQEKFVHNFREFLLDISQ
jgi:hypothetical protein